MKLVASCLVDLLFKQITLLFCILILQFGSKKTLGQGMPRGQPTYVYPPSMKTVIRNIIPGGLADYNDPTHDSVSFSMQQFSCDHFESFWIHCRRPYRNATYLLEPNNECYCSSKEWWGILQCANILCDISQQKTKYYDQNIDFRTSFHYEIHPLH